MWNMLEVTSCRQWERKTSTSVAPIVFSMPFLVGPFLEEGHFVSHVGFWRTQLIPSGDLSCKFVAPVAQTVNDWSFVLPDLVFRRLYWHLSFHCRPKSHCPIVKWHTAPSQICYLKGLWANCLRRGGTVETFRSPFPNFQFCPCQLCVPRLSLFSWFCHLQICLSLLKHTKHQELHTDTCTHRGKPYTNI